MGKIQKAIAAIYAEKQEMGKIRQKDLAKALGCSQATVSHILNGSRTLSEKWIEALCEQLDISLGDIEEVKSRPPDPEELRECYVRLKRLYETRYVPGFRSVSRNIEDWLEDVPHASAGQNADSATKVVKGDFTIKEPPALDYSDPKHEHDAPREEIYEEIPFFDDFRVPAGRPDEVLADSRMKVRQVVRHLAKGNRYVIRVTGDSMEPRIQSGDLVLVDYAKEPRSGNVVIAIINGKAVIKKFLRQKGVPVLRSLNPKYPDIVATEGDQFTIAGVVLKVVESEL
jgi:SOS-response transcriptional repressor LexA